MNTFLDRLPDAVQGRARRLQRHAAAARHADARPHASCARRSSYLEPEAGTALGDGLAAAVHMLTQLAAARTATCASRASPCPARSSCSPTAPRTAASCSPYQAALDAKKAGVRVYPVSLGTPNGTVDLRLRRLHEPGPGPARPGDDGDDRPDDRRPGLHRRRPPRASSTSTARSARASGARPRRSRSPPGSRPPRPSACSAAVAVGRLARRRRIP